MQKTISGIELIRMIQTGKLKPKTELRIKGYNDKKVRYEDADMLIDLKTNEELTISWLIDTEFEIISKNKEIDIDSIEEYETKYTERCIDKEVKDKINELVKAVKQLNEKIGKK